MPDFSKALRRLRGDHHGSTHPVEAAHPSVAAAFSISRQLDFLRARHGDRSGEQVAVSRAETLPAGEVETTPFGTHYVVRAVYPHDHFHGKVRLGRFSCQELQLLMSLMRQRGGVENRERIVFLDTETTGMQGGTGMCPFLVGLGFFQGDDFHLIQYFIRDFDEEPSMLHGLSQFLKGFDLVITYNGAAFDIPLLEIRFRLARFDKPFESIQHYDLLPTARRLWRNAHGSCRLVALEREIVSFLRGPDVPGAMIPRLYFDFLNHRSQSLLRSVFTHNAYDIVSLAALTVAASDRVVAEPAQLDDPLDLYSLARVMENSLNWRRSIQFYEMAIAGGLPELTQQKALENLAVVCRRNGDHERSREICFELMSRPQFSLIGYEGAAIYYEKVAKDPESARCLLLEALQRLGNTNEDNRRRKRVEHRCDRLRQKTMAFSPSSATS